MIRTALGAPFLSKFAIFDFLFQNLILDPLIFVKDFYLIKLKNLTPMGVKIASLSNKLLEFSDQIFLIIEKKSLWFSGRAESFGWQIVKGGEKGGRCPGNGESGRGGAHSASLPSQAVGDEW